MLHTKTLFIYFMKQYQHPYRIILVFLVGLLLKNGHLVTGFYTCISVLDKYCGVCKMPLSTLTRQRNSVVWPPNIFINGTWYYLYVAFEWFLHNPLYDHDCWKAFTQRFMNVCVSCEIVMMKCIFNIVYLNVCECELLSVSFIFYHLY